MATDMKEIREHMSKVHVCMSGLQYIPLFVMWLHGHFFTNIPTRRPAVLYVFSPIAADDTRGSSQSRPSRAIHMPKLPILYGCNRSQKQHLPMLQSGVFAGYLSVKFALNVFEFPMDGGYFLPLGMILPLQSFHVSDANVSNSFPTCCLRLPTPLDPIDPNDTIRHLPDHPECRCVMGKQ
uniref:Uncharacterized protein n=1 Tax=Strigamia maritima TaxID=126957 RepID=T1JD95_STRMM